MRRSEFYDSITSIDDAIDFIRENELWDDFDAIIDEDQVYDYIWDDIRNFDDGWEELRDALNSLDGIGDYDWYFCDGSFSYRGITNERDLYWIKDRIYEIMCDNDYWDEDEPEIEDEDMLEDEPEDDMELDDSADFNGLYTACSGMVNVLMEEDADCKRKDYAEFAGAFNELIK